MKGRLFLIFAASVALAACDTSPVGPGFRLAELVTVSTQGLSTDLLLPPFENSLELFGEGWEELSAQQAQTSGLWVEGVTAEFRFYAAFDGALTLDAEARAVGTADRPQSVELVLNGHAVHSQTMSESWTRYQWSLPAEHVEVGWNAITLSFDQALRPAEVNPGNPDPRRLAARFRRLAIRTPLDRAVWADRPSVVSVTPPLATHEDPVTISMPTDSHLDLYLVPTRPRRLQAGSMRFQPTSAGSWTSGVRLSLSRNRVHVTP